MYKFLIYLLFLLSLVGCKTTHLGGDSIGRLTSKQEILVSHSIKRLSANNFLFKRSNFTIESEALNQGLTGSYFIQKDSFIIFSLQALLGIEVARVKISPNEVIIIDRFNKKVSFLNYTTFINKYAKGLSFPILQALLLNSSFDLGASDSNYINSTSFTSDFQDSLLIVKKQPSTMLSWLKTPKVSELEQIFVFDVSDGNLVQTFITESNLKSSIKIEYFNFLSIGGCSLPLKICILATVNDYSYKLNLSSNSFIPNSDTGISFSIPTGYDKIQK